MIRIDRARVEPFDDEDRVDDRIRRLALEIRWHKGGVAVTASPLPIAAVMAYRSDCVGRAFTARADAGLPAAVITGADDDQEGDDESHRETPATASTRGTSISNTTFEITTLRSVGV